MLLPAWPSNQDCTLPPLIASEPKLLLGVSHATTELVMLNKPDSAFATESEPTRKQFLYVAGPVTNTFFNIPAVPARRRIPFVPFAPTIVTFSIIGLVSGVALESNSELSASIALSPSPSACWI